MRVAGTSPPETDTLVVSVDGVAVQTFTEPPSFEPDYSLRQIDLTPYADGGPHALLFSYNGPTAGIANFLVDNVELFCAPALPSLSIDDAVVTEGNSGTTTARFTVTLSAPSNQTVTVAYTTGTGTATAGGDYVAAPGTATFALGSLTQSIEIVVLGDGLDEVNETFTVNLSSPANATISDAQGVGVINDDDLPPSLAIDNVTVTENAGSALFTATLSAASGQQVTVDYASADGTATATAPFDYTAASGTLTFAPGVTTQPITVPVSYDDMVEPSEVFFVNLGSPVNATIEDGQGVGTINDPPDLIFKDGFESGDLSAWSSSVADGGDLSVSAAAALKSTTFGLQGLVDDTTSIFVRDDSPLNENRYRARFYFDPNDFDPGEAAGFFRIRILIAFNASNQRLITLVLRRQGGAYSIMGRVRRDDGSRADTGFFGITNAPHFVEFDWRRSSGPGASDGQFALLIDDAVVSTLTGIDNDSSPVDFVRIGVMVLKSAAASGTMYFDEFESRRLTPIGP
jgi:hypothetical protein